MMKINNPPSENPDAEDVQQYCTGVLLQYANEIGLDLTGVDLPGFIIDEFRDTASFLRKRNCIVFPSVEHLYNGESLAEEIGHYLREIFREGGEGEREEYVTAECVGMLTRKKFHSCLDSDQQSAYFPKGFPITGITKKNRKGFLENARYWRSQYKQVKELESSLDNVPDTAPADEVMQVRENIQSIAETVRAPYSEAMSDLIHIRGYDLADRVDIDDIEDWKAIYSLPDKDLREFLRKHQKKDE